MIDRLPPTLRYALASGSGAALASVFAKLAFDAAILPGLLAGQPHWALLLARGVCLAGIFLSNVAMMALFARCLKESNSLAATVSNCAANFCLTGLFGVVCFNEQLPLAWWLGALLLVAGLYLIQLDPSSSTASIKSD